MLNLRQRRRLPLLLLVASASACGDTSTDTVTGIVASASDPAPSAEQPAKLRDGVGVEPGTALLGAVRVAASPDSVPRKWSVLLEVEDDPLAAYRAYLNALGFQGDGAANPGCQSKDEYGRTGCSSFFSGELPSGDVRSVSLELASVGGDVASRYLLRLVVRPTASVTDEPALPPAEDTARNRRARRLLQRLEVPGQPSLVATPPHPAADPVQVGDSLPGHDLPGGLLGGGSYELLEGSELTAKYGDGSITGGFNLLMHLTGTVPAADVLKGYAAQASQSSAAPTTSTFEEDDTFYTTVLPPGEAGGYQATLTLVDQPGAADDYLFYDLVND